MKLTDKSIVYILSAALLLSLAGIIFNLNQLGGIYGLGLLTGAATDSGTGTSTITISSSTSITNHVISIAFGSGFVNASCTECMMDSNGFHNQTGNCCRGFNNVSSGFLLENTGNVNLSVNYSCSGSCTYGTFIGGTGQRGFQLKATPNNAAGQSGETGAADSVASCAGLMFLGWNITSTDYGITNRPQARYYNVTSLGAYLCGNGSAYPLDFTDTQDAGVIDINISIPSDAATGSEKTATFTFTGHSSG